MKKFLKYAGACALLFVVVGFILMLAAPGIVFEHTGDTLSGAKAIFGEDNLKGGAAGAVGFVFVLLASIVLIVGIVLPILKITALDKASGVLNLVAVLLLIIAGILMFCVRNSWVTANGKLVGDYTKLGAGMVFAGIFYMVAGLIAIAPAVVDFIEKK